jgi:hypothetical protein
VLSTRPAFEPGTALETVTAAANKTTLHPVDHERVIGESLG